jgi:lactoylglutathione lyase
MQLRYVMKFVADMDRAVAFHRDALGLTLRFASPEWSEFETGPTTLALHLADEHHPAGSCQLGFGSDDLDALYGERERRGIEFTAPPADLHGQRIARFVDPDGAETSVSG